jgi:hypothetical protein
VTYGLVVFRERTIIDDNLHEERRSQIITQMNGCNIIPNYNLWFRVEEIKTE